MMVKRGEIWLADLNPTRGSEQAGTRPVLIFQNNLVNKFTTTVLAIPLTTNLRRAALPSCVQIAKGEGGLTSASVALCHQLRVLDTTRLQRKMDAVSQETILALESCLMFTMGIV
ncbi:MAG: type II toxin-antitoxin system PemK/MazF family toxin [Anaerolineae bacterium]|nr:type II toxin-antitoxin system PemK/MazF family toxin [Anaerolineales bacterium]MCQ3977433.1 type II toxin-antitoxin system PemK/MazF family toxin [Anaerolineae bacterium]